MMAFSGVTSQCEERGFRIFEDPRGRTSRSPSPRPGRDKVFFAVTEDDWSLVGKSCFLLAPLELGTVDPDAMQHSELAGDSGLGLLEADAFGQPHTPSFQD